MFLREFTSKPMLEDDPDDFTGQSYERLKARMGRARAEGELDDFTGKAYDRLLAKMAKSREEGSLDDFTGKALIKMQAGMQANREKAIAAGFVKPDGSADTRAYFASIAKKQDAVAKAADEKYWRDNPNGKWEKIGNVTSMVMPPEQHHPDAIKAQGLKIDAAHKARTKAWKARNQIGIDAANAAMKRPADRAEPPTTTEGDMKADREAGIKWVDNPNWKRLHDMDDEMIHAYLDHKKSVKKEVRSYKYGKKGLV